VSKYLPEVPFWWPYVALGAVVWAALAWAFGWPHERPTFLVTFIFAYGLGARYGYGRKTA
jgi:hypothetical protein